MPAPKSPLVDRVVALRASLVEKDPHQLASQTAAEFLPSEGESGFFRFQYWGNPVLLPVKDYIACDAETDQPLDVIHQAMIGYYFDTSRGSPSSESWISFTELPDGQFYSSAFQGYTGKKLLSAFETDYDRFLNRCREIYGEEITFADGAYRFQILPRAAVLAVLWMGDEEFPPTYKILFEENISYHLPTDGCAILGSMITGRLIQEPA